MKLGIMQPYFLPYIGYWQLLNAVDEYVVYDDVNFIKGGWINRNRILVQGRTQYMNIQMSGSSAYKHINEIGVEPSLRWREKLLATIRMAYGRAPFYHDTEALVSRLIMNEETNLARYVYASIREIAAYLGIKTHLLLSSEIEQDRSLHAEERVLDICRRLGATEYLNAIGGQELYSPQHFAAHGIKLTFLQAHAEPYPQLADAFMPNLSILDVIMCNSRDKLRTMLTDFKLLDGKTGSGAHA